MGIGTASDLQVYQPFFQAGYYEGESQVVDWFNAASGNAILMVTNRRIGEVHREAFFKNDPALFRRIDRTSVATLTPSPLVTGEKQTVKLEIGIGPKSMTHNSWLKIGEDPATMLFQLGVQVGLGQTKFLFNKAMIAAEAAITKVSPGSAGSVTYDATGEATPTLEYPHLANGIALLGDMSDEVIAFAMHSRPWHDLMIGNTVNNIFQVTGVTINDGIVASLNRRVVKSDAPAFITSTTTSGVNTYHTLGLAQNSVVIEHTEPPIIVFEGPITGGEQISYTYQGELAVNVGVLGYTWDLGSGGVNPNDAALGSGSNWTLTVSDPKLAAGVAIRHL